MVKSTSSLSGETCRVDADIPLADAEGYSLRIEILHLAHSAECLKVLASGHNIGARAAHFCACTERFGGCSAQSFFQRVPHRNSPKCAASLLSFSRVIPSEGNFSRITLGKIAADLTLFSTCGEIR